MGRRIPFSLLVISIQILAIAAQSDYAYLSALKDIWENTPPNWVGTDPCGDRWEGIGCTNSRVTSITLLSMNLTGTLSGDIPNLSELQTLDLSYNPGLTGSIPPSIGNMRKLSTLNLVGCGFTGPIPDTIGSLQQLISLSLNSNGLSGPIPPSIGNLTNLNRLDLADNELSGQIPVSNGSRPGLDMLVKTKRFHFGNNRLSGEIPNQLFSSSMKLIHLLLENNQLTGSIPSTLGLVKTLEVVRLDGNSFTGSVPSNINNLSSVNDLFLSNNKLTGALPNLTGMNFLHYVDLSNNTFDVSDVPSWFSTLQSLTTLMLQNTRLQGSVPVALFSAPQLQTVVLRNNQLNGTLDIGSSYSSQLQEVDLQNNLISGFTQRAGYDIGLTLAGNPVCEEAGGIDEKYCKVPRPPTDSYSTLPTNCVPSTCSSEQISSPNCQCAYPYTGKILFRAPTFSSLGNSSIYISLQESMMVSFQSHRLPVDSVSLKTSMTVVDDYLVISLEIFPLGQDYFNRTGVSAIGFVLSNQTYKPPPDFGPFFFIGEGYQYFSDSQGGTDHKKRNKVKEVSLAVLAVVLLLCLSLALYIWRKKKKREMQDQEQQHEQLDREGENSSEQYLISERQKEDLELPLLDLATVAKATNNFSDGNKLGEGGFGPVYKGILEDGQEIAVKRLSKYSSQGLEQFKNEVICITKLQHRNLVKLLGCCIEGDEKLLIYEYMPNNSLYSFIFDPTRSKLLDWPKRFNIINGIARGLLYLHQDSRLRIVHRDLKAENVLLDIDMNPKISDFGTAKSFRGDETEANTMRVVGTYGYMSPEYATDGVFSVKSDVYSFGVLVLEFVSGMKNRGFIHQDHHHNLLGHAWILHNEGRSLEMVDPNLGGSFYLSEVLRSIHVALLCVQQFPEDRPTMSSVVVMLTGEGALPQPKEPGFFTKRNLVSDYSTSTPEAISANEISMTLFDGR